MLPDGVQLSLWWWAGAWRVASENDPEAGEHLHPPEIDPQAQPLKGLQRVRDDRTLAHLFWQAWCNGEVLGRGGDAESQIMWLRST